MVEQHALLMYNRSDKSHIFSHPMKPINTHTQTWLGIMPTSKAHHPQFTDNSFIMVGFIFKTCHHKLLLVKNELVLHTFDLLPLSL